MYVLSHPVFSLCGMASYLVVAVDDLSADEEAISDDSGADADIEEETESTAVTVEDVYNVSVTQTYFLLVIAFGVFLACGVMIARVFWDRMK